MSKLSAGTTMLKVDAPENHQKYPASIVGVNRLEELIMNSMANNGMMPCL